MSGLCGKLEGVLERFGLPDGDAAFDLMFNFFGSGADQEHKNCFVTQRRAQHGVVAVFVLAAQNHDNSSREGFKRLERGVNIGGFRIVVIADSLNLCDEFDAMLHTCKGANRFRDLRRPCARKPRCNCGCENVFKVVRAGERNFPAIENFVVSTSLPEDDFPISNERSLLDIRLPAEPVHLRKRWSILGAYRIVRVQNGEILAGLIFEDSGFRGSICGQGFVPVQMIRRQIQENRDVGSKSVDQFELKAA